MYRVRVPQQRLRATGGIEAAQQGFEVPQGVVVPRRGLVSGGQAGEFGFAPGRIGHEWSGEAVPAGGEVGGHARKGTRRCPMVWAGPA